MAPPGRMRGDGRKAKNAKKTLLRLLGYMRKHIPTLVIVLICYLVPTLLLGEYMGGVFFADLQGLLIPQAGLHLANVGAADQQHTKTALSNATADGQGQLAV